MGLKMDLPHILFAWEMGANFGHVAQIVGVARALQGRARITMALREPEGLRRLAPDLPVTLLKAPHAVPSTRRVQLPSGLNYAGVLRHEGWDHAEDLAAQIEAWTTLFDLTRPDVVACQAAPTAQLALMGRDLPVVAFGSGFDAPPQTTPLPAFDPTPPQGHPETAAQQEAAVLSIANQALARHRRPPLSQFTDLLRAGTQALTTVPPLDHYADRAQLQSQPVTYLGQISFQTGGIRAQWQAAPGARGHRIFAYLRPGQHGFDQTAQALRQLAGDHDILLAAPGITAPLAEDLRSAGAQVLDGAARLDSLLEGATLGVSHGSNGIAYQFLRAGLPQMCLPAHTEQRMVTRTLGRQQLAIGYVGNYQADDVARGMLHCAANDTLRQNAETTGRALTARTDQPAQAVADLILAQL